MVGLRKFKCYRRTKRPYTRKSKYKKKGYIKAVPTIKIVKFNMGDQKKKFTNKLSLLSKDKVQIRHNALESCRLVVNRLLNKKLGNNYYMQVIVYPHHILRENKMLTGAGADRMQSGMQKSFGKAVSIAAQVKKGQAIFSVDIDKDNIEIAKEALKKAIPRLPCKCSVEVS